MRVLVDIRHLTHAEPSGVGEYTIQLLRALFRLQTDNEYVLFSTGSRRPDLRLLIEQQPTSTHVTPLHIPVPNKLLNAAIRLGNTPRLERLAGGQFDVQFLPNINFIPLPFRTPTVLTVHDLTWRLFPECYSRKMRLWHRAVHAERLIQQADALIVPSHATARDVERVFGPGMHPRVIPHGISPSFTNTPSPTDHGVRSRLKLPKRFVLFVGTLEPRKNLVAILDAVASYRAASQNDIHLVLAGRLGWNSREIQQRLHTPSVKAWVHVLGYIPSEERSAVYRQAEALVWPSLYEGFGLPVLEALACGTPVITSATSSLPEVAGNAAILVDPYNPADITSALTELLENPALAQKLRQDGVKQAGTFSWKRAAEDTARVLRETAKR